MKYKIRDEQFSDRYFAEGELFDTLEEIREQLCDYHSVDYTGEERDIEDYTLAEILDYGEWSIETENGDPVDIYKVCWACGEPLTALEATYDNIWQARFCKKCSPHCVGCGEPLKDPQLVEEGALYCDI